MENENKIEGERWEMKRRTNNRNRRRINIGRIDE